MNRERFIRSRRADWQRLEALLNRVQHQRLGKWTGQEVGDLSTLYRSVCYDLSLVQSREWGLRLERYLNDLVARGHNCLYRSPPRSLNLLAEFLFDGFPRKLREYKTFFFIALAIFAIPFFLSMLIVAIDPAVGEQLVPRDNLDNAVESYSKGLYTHIDARYAGERTMMTGFYIFNNIGIAFRCFAQGIFFGIGTVKELLLNGIVLGGVMGYLINKGLADNFFSFAISHGSFELTAIVVAGAAGLILGWGLIHPGEHGRIQSIRRHGKDAVQIVAGAGFMLFVAALIEGYVSPSTLPHAIKYIIGSILWLVVFVYLMFGGRGTIERANTWRDRLRTKREAES